jgi:hypothetical protein
MFKLLSNKAPFIEKNSPIPCAHGFQTIPFAERNAKPIDPTSTLNHAPL